MKKIDDYANYPWVFWVSVSYRPKWFKAFWKTRGANFIEYQLWIFKVSIGRPWLKNAFDSFRKDHTSRHVHETNKTNLKSPFSFLIKTKK